MMRRMSFILCLLGMILTGTLRAEAETLQIVQTWTIPSFKGHYDLKQFTGLGLDGRTQNISLSNDTGWCEIAYRQGQFRADGSFMAPTQGYRLGAVASSPFGVYVYDVLSHSIMGERGIYKLPQPVLHPTGMTFFQNKIYIADGSQGILYEIQIDGGQAKILAEHPFLRGVTGLAASPDRLYVAAGNTIYIYNGQLNEINRFQLGPKINGLTRGPLDELIAVGEGDNKLYRIEIK